jgi:hypothetical protein
MIVLDAAPAILRARGAPVYFVSAEETIEYARIHDIVRWIVFGDPEGWWPLYTQAGPVNLPQSQNGGSTSPCVVDCAVCEHPGRVADNVRQARSST